MSSVQITTILKAIEASFGRALFESAVSEILGHAPSASVAKTVKVKKEAGPYPKGEIPEHLKEWHALVATVREEMTSAGWTHPETGKPPSHRDAMAEASKRKIAEATPEEAAKKAEVKAKKAAKKAAAAEAGSDSDATPTDGSVKKAGRPKMTDEQKAAAKAARAEKKAAAELVSESVSESEGSAPAAPVVAEVKKAGRPKMTDEQKAAAKAKKAAKKAAATTTAPAAESQGMDAYPCEIDGKPCVKIMDGYIYEYENEEVGAYLGFQNPDGSLDTLKQHKLHVD
jgi:hypothetical protein